MTTVFTKEGLEKARQILASIPESHRDLLIQSARSTNSVPRIPADKPEQGEAMNFDVVRDLRQLADWTETVLLKIDKAGLPKPDYQSVVDDTVELFWDKADAEKYRPGFTRFQVYIFSTGDVDADLATWRSDGQPIRRRTLESFQASDALPEDFIKTIQDVVRPLKETK